MNYEKKQLLSGVISLIVSLIIVFITLRSNAWATKADKAEVNRIEKEVKKDIKRNTDDILRLIEEQNAFEIRLYEKLDDHQKQIIDLLKK